MLVYRIILAKYSAALVASGRAARWNPNDVDVIYTASSRSLACLENVVHRNKLGLNNAFDVQIIEIPDALQIKNISLENLKESWTDFDQMAATQRLGEEWIKNKESAILQVPSSIVNEETNYLLNPKHNNFTQIKIVKVQPFVFDSRIKL